MTTEKNHDDGRNENDDDQNENDDVFGEEQFDEFLEQYKNAPIDDKKQVVDSFVQSICEEIHRKAATYANAKDYTHTIPTSFQNQVVMRLLGGALEKKMNKSPFESLDAFWAYLWEMFCNRTKDIYKETVTKPKDIIIIAEKKGLRDYSDPVDCTLIDLFDKLFPLLEPHEVDLIVEKILNGRTFPQIKEKLGLKVTDQALSQKFKRLLKRIKTDPRFAFMWPDGYIPEPEKNQ